MKRRISDAAFLPSSAPGAPTQKRDGDVEACYELACQFADEFFTRYGEENALTRWASKARDNLEGIRRGPKVA